MQDEEHRFYPPYQGVGMAKLISNGKSVPYDPDLVELAKILRKNMTSQERKLWYFLRELKPRFLRQRPILYYIADFYCPEKKLIIEIDGMHHQTKEGFGADQVRTKILNDYGLDLVRFTNIEVDYQFFKILDKIKTLVVNDKNVHF